tara:strand:- start:23028 stop:25772 length:2745 start_codon:yes stop_codon:yes gene_type:complete
MCLALGLFACSSEIPVEEHLSNARQQLDEAQYSAAVIELKNALRGDAANSEARLLLGKAYVELGSYADAGKELQRALELDVQAERALPPLSRALLAQNKLEQLYALDTASLSARARAVVLASQGWGKLREFDRDAGSRLVQQALSDDPTSVYAQFVFARFLAGTTAGDFTQTREQLDKVLALDPQYAPAWSLLADIEARQRQVDAADAAYSKAIEFGAAPFSDRYKRATLRLLQGDEAGARKDSVALMKLSPQHPGALYLRGVLHYRDGKYDDAIPDFEAAARYEDQYPLALFYLAVINARKGNLSQAEVFASRYLAPEPDNVAGAKLLASIRAKAGDHVGAEELLSSVVERNPEDVDAMNMLASSLMAQGKQSEGIELLSRAARLQPDSGQAQARLGAGLLVTGDIAASLERLEAARQLDPQLQQADALLVSAQLRRKDFDGALQAISEFEEKNPEQSVSETIRGTVYLRAGNQQAAEAAFNRALADSPGDVVANNSLAAMAVQREDYAVAARHYQNILDENPEHEQTLLKLSALYERSGDLQSAAATLEQAVQVTPEALEPRIILARVYLLQGQAADAARLLGEGTGDYGDNAEFLYLQGLSQLKLGDYKAARSSFEQVLKKFPDASQTHYQLGMVFKQLQNEEKMIRHWDKAVELSPSYISPRIELARVYLKYGDRDAAVEQLRFLRKLDSSHPEVLQLDAVRARMDGDMREARELTETAFEKSPTARNLLVYTRQLWLMGERDSAQDALQGWLEEHPEDVAVGLEMALMYEGRGQLDQAIAQYQRVLDSEPQSITALNNLAWHLREKDPEKALQYAEQAVKVSDSSASTLDTLAMVLLSNRQLDKAQRAIERSLRSEGNNPASLYHSALINVAAGETDAAQTTLTRLLARHDNFPQKDEAQALLQDLNSN